MPNPFTLKVIADKKDFCNRSKEIADLTGHAESKTNVVLFSPRRHGKTSLAKIVQAGLSERGWTTIYADMFGLSSVDNLAGRIAKGVYQGLYERKTAMQKLASAFKSFRPVLRPEEDGVSISVENASPNLFGADLLEKTMEDLGDFVRKKDGKVHVVFDEFQDVTDVGDFNVEGILRSYIQRQDASFFFVGSRRRILLEMFTDKRRPFFQSAVNYRLKELPGEELVRFVVGKFEDGGKKCASSAAEKIVGAVSSHPYYCQKLALFVFNIAEKEANDRDVDEGLRLLYENESYVFEAIVQGLSPKQIAVLKAVAREPSKSILSARYMAKHGLKSIGGVQAGLKKLLSLDHVEKSEEGVYRVVDPVFSTWLIRE